MARRTTGCQPRFSAVMWARWSAHLSHGLSGPGRGAGPHVRWRQSNGPAQLEQRQLLQASRAGPTTGGGGLSGRPFAP